MVSLLQQYQASLLTSSSLDMLVQHYAFVDEIEKAPV
jgi:hypothetical protein